MSVDVPGWSMMDASLSRLARKSVPRVIFDLADDFPVGAKEVAEKLEPDGFLANFRQKGTVTVEKGGTVITL